MNISRRNLNYLTIFCLGILGNFLTGAKQSEPVFFYFGIIFNILLIISVIVLPSRMKIYPFLFFLFCIPDLTESMVDVISTGHLYSATLWQLDYGILRAFLVFVVIILFLIITYPDKSIHFKKIDVLFMTYFFSVPIIISVYYGYTFWENIENIVSDLKYPVVLILGIMLFSRYLSGPAQHLKKIIFFSVILIFATICFHIISFILGIESTMISGVNRVSVDSSKGVVIALIILLIVRMNEVPRKLSYALLIVSFIFLLIVYQTRMLIVSCLLGLMLFYLLLPLKQKITNFIATGLTAILLLGLIFVLFPQVGDIMLKRFRINLIGTGYDMRIEDVDVVRVIGAKNIYTQISRSNAYLTGFGYGSSYTDEDYMFPEILDLTSAFPESSIDSSKFYRIHDFILHTFLKFGLVGLVISTCMFSIPFFRLLRRYKRMNRLTQQYALVAICFLPTVYFSFFWTIKTILISSMFIVFMRRVLEVHEIN